MNRSTITKQSVFYVAMATATVLLIPSIAMQFTQKVNWSLMDFILAAFLLFGSGLAYLAVSQRFTKPMQRIIIAGIIALLLFITWVQLAAGIFD